ncbi:MAG: endonuclease/exonuclease/phosphatase family protein [Tannerella sp.]|jgi:endonuclease/exonuclease/phosphatase family metal-dependent hydrolase|nr:endonuclease/exonuclease/phosphatase family protein [Tannerella sp.]
MLGKNYFMFILLFSCLPTMMHTQKATAKKPKTLTVASYNQLFEYSHRIPEDSSQQWVNRKKVMKKIFEDNKFDLVGAQETMTFQLAEIKTWPDLDWIGAGRSSGGYEKNEEHDAVIWRKSRLEMLEHGDFWYSDTPEVSSHSWDSPCCPRMCTWVKFKDKRTKKIFFIFNSHFDHIGVVSKKNSATLLLAKVKEIAGNNPVILTGDFNSEPQSEPIQIILNDGAFSDSRAVSKRAPEGPNGTLHGFTNLNPTGIIDHVFVTKNIRVNTYRVIDGELKTKAWASDHLPVAVNVEF